MDSTLLRTADARTQPGPSRRWPEELLTDQERCDREAVSRAIAGPADGVATAVLELVARGVLDRVAARAVLLVADGRLDERDLKQLLRPHAKPRPVRTTAPADGDAIAPPRTGETLGRYVVGDPLGRGATARVYRSSHPTLGLPVALKVPHRADAAAAEQVRAEAAALAGLAHPNVVRLWGLEHAADRPFLVLECADGESLAATLRRDGRVSPRRAYRATLAAARGLRAAHRRGVVHGDVKPGNVLGTRAGRYKLADFGSAHRQHAGPDGGRVDGSWAYRAPEGFAGPTDPRSDVYSLGLTLHHLLTGAPAVAGGFDDCLEQHRGLALEPAHWAVQGVTPAVSALIRRMTARHPADRFPDCDAFLLAARRAFTHRGTDR